VKSDKAYKAACRITKSRRQKTKQSFVFNNLHNISRLGIEVADVSVKAPSGEQGP
jgi:hypothetical protein